MTGRVISWFSCGAASAVTTKLVLEQYPDAIIARIVIDNEHEDNNRFAADCAEWFGKPITELRSQKYKDCWDVWERTRFLTGPTGARCTTELKKRVRQDFQQPGDRQAFGYHAKEKDRAISFAKHNIEVNAFFPLIERSFSKADCFRLVKAAGLELPEMYRLGFPNANCVGCVKGGKGYWNMVREHFPHVFERMAQTEEITGATCLIDKSLRELQPDEGRQEPIDLPDCGLFCGEHSYL